MIGIAPFPGGGRIIKIYRDLSTTSIASTTTYTFSGMSFGPAAADRYLVACYAWITGGLPVYSSSTIGGVTATKLVESLGSNTRTAIAIAAVPSGTSGNVVLNLSSGSNMFGCALYSITNMSSPAAVSTGTDTSSPNQAALDVPAGGSVIGVCFANSVNDATWTNATEDAAVAIAGLATFEAASADYDNQQTALNVQAVQGGNTAFSAVSFGP